MRQRSASTHNGHPLIFIKREVLVPMLPNFLRTPSGDSVPVAELSEDEIREIGAKWTEALLSHAKKKRASSAASGS